MHVSRQPVNPSQVREEQDTFMGKSLLDPVYPPQYSNIVWAVEKMLQDAVDN